MAATLVGEVLIKAASRADEVAAKTASTANEVVAEAASISWRQPRQTGSWPRWRPRHGRDLSGGGRGQDGVTKAASRADSHGEEVVAEAASTSWRQPQQTRL